MSGPFASRTSVAGAVLGLLAVPLLVGGIPDDAPAAAATSATALAAEANQCESLTGAVVNEWNQEIRPDIDVVLNGIQAVGRIAAKGERVSLGSQVVRAGTGESPNEMAARAMADALAMLVGGVSGPWSQIGPRGLELPGTASGRITPVVGTTRMFITPPNLTHNAARITVTKLDGRQRAEIVICKAPYDDPGNYTRVRVFEFDNGLANAGDSQRVTIQNSRGYYFTIKVRKFVGTNAFEYRVRAEPAGGSALE